jgi:ribokinase
VHMIGAVGADDGANAILELQAEGVDVTHVASLPGPTGHAAVLVDAGTGENQIAVAPGANALVSVDQVDEAIEALDLSPQDVVVLSFEVPDTPLRVAAGLAGWIGARLVVNPAPAQADYADLVEKAIATPNAHELTALVTQRGLAADPGLGEAAAAIALAAHTGAPVIVTLGARGALLADADGSEHFAGHTVAAVDTTGAGDTLTGVLAASLAQGYPLRTSVRRAVAAAALAVTKPGARVGMPTAAAIDALLSGPDRS